MLRGYAIEGKLSLYWFFVLGALGIFFPFYSLYLREHLGLTGTQTGIVMASVPFMGMAAQPLWGHLADRTGSRTRILTLLTLGAAFGFAGMFFARDFQSVLAATAATAIFSAAVMPMTVSVCLALLDDRGDHAFGLTRVWGTIGFLVGVMAVPAALGAFAPFDSSERPALAWILPAAAATFLVAALVSATFPNRGAVSARAHRGDLALLLAHGPFVRLLVFMLTCYLCLQGPMALFPLYVQSLGGTAGGTVETISRMWLFMLILEIPLVALTGTGLTRFGARGLLAIGITSGAARWLVCGWATELWLVYAAQVLHGLTVIGLILGAPLYVEAVVPERLRSTGQSLLSMVGVSLGGILSNLASGWLVDAFGPRAPALAGGCGALLLAAALPWLVPAVRGGPDPDHFPAPMDTGESI